MVKNRYRIIHNQLDRLRKVPVPAVLHCCHHSESLVIQVRSEPDELRGNCGGHTAVPYSSRVGATRENNITVNVFKI